MIDATAHATMKALALACLLSCVGPTIRNRSHDGEFRLVFHNETAQAVCAIHVYRFGQPERGANWLEPQTEVQARESIELWLAPDTYQFYAESCAYERDLATGYAPSVVMNAHGVVALFNEADAASKSAAQELAHANENSTMIPAKYKRNTAPTKRPANQRAAPRTRGAR